MHLQRGQAPTDDVWYRGPLSVPGPSPPGAGVCSRVPYSSRSPQSSDLEEMGFHDVEKNKKLMVMHNGSLKSTIKSLVSEYK